MYFPKRLELSFLIVFALPNAENKMQIKIFKITKYNARNDKYVLLKKRTKSYNWNGFNFSIIVEHDSTMK